MTEPSANTPAGAAHAGTAHAATGTAPETSCAVLIIGAGPTGLFLAALLARRGVDVQVLERRTAPTAYSRAIGLHPPALRALAELGLDREAVRLGEQIRSGRASCRRRELGAVDFTRAWPARPFVLALPQSRTETLLAERLARLAPAALRRGWEVTGLQETARDAMVTARRSSGEAGVLRVRAGVVIGTDGARSRVRDLLDIPVSGREYPDTYLMGDLADPAAGHGVREALIHLDPGGVVESFPIPDGRRRWVVHTGTDGAEASPQRLAALVRERTAAVLDPATISMLSPFTVRRCTARRLLTRRCVLLGDAAHEVSPIGGQGITLGWLDALDLAPLLVRHAAEQDARQDARTIAEQAAGPLRTNPAWHRVERRIRRRSRIAGALAGVNTALGRPAGPRVSALRALAVRAALATPLHRTMAWAYSMGWVR